MGSRSVLPIVGLSYKAYPILAFLTHLLSLSLPLGLLYYFGVDSFRLLVERFTPVRASLLVAMSSSAGYEALAVYLGSILQDSNCLGLSPEEIRAMSVEVVKSKTKKEIVDWCGTLLLDERVAAELIERRHAARLRFDDDDDGDDGDGVPAKKGRQLTAKGKRRGVPLNDKKKKGRDGKAAAEDTGTLQPGKFECGCFATLHQLQTNCLNCGRIICQQEAADTCYFCGLEPGRCVAYEIAVQDGKITEAAQEKNEALYAAALERRDRLLEYAANRAKRTAVIDDQQASLFSPQNAWLSPSERKEEEKNAAAEERKRRVEEMHRRTGAYVVHLDFVNRNVSLGALPAAEPAPTRAAPQDVEPIGQETEMDKGEEQQEEEEQDDDVVPDARAERAPSTLFNIWYSTDGSKVDDPRTMGKGARQEPAPAPQEAVPARRILVVSSKRVQQDYFEDDNATFEEGMRAPGLVQVAPAVTEELPEPANSATIKDCIPYAMRQRDDGICLSMHQPWASLLVHGIKTHEGRGWPTDYRGRLWIHAASQQPVEVAEVEAHYRQFVPPGTPFPEHYPTKALLGSVYLVDCLDREAYEDRFAPEERQEDSPFSFLCVEPAALPFPLPMVGNHKLFLLEHRIHTAAKKQLGEVQRKHPGREHRGCHGWAANQPMVKELPGTGLPLGKEVEEMHPCSWPSVSERGAALYFHIIAFFFFFLFTFSGATINELKVLHRYCIYRAYLRGTLLCRAASSFDIISSVLVCPHVFFFMFAPVPPSLLTPLHSFALVVVIMESADTTVGGKRLREADDVDGRGIWSDDSSSSSSAESAGEDELDHLIAHAEATASVAKTRTATSAAGQLLASSRNRLLEDTLAQLKADLLAPVASSTELVVVNAADESAEVMDKLLARKAPPPPAEEVKKLRRLQYVDHSLISYMDVEKCFYIPPADVRRLTPAQVKELLQELDGAKMSGKDAPPPMRTWDGTGLSDAVLQKLEEEGFCAPFAVQSLAAPVLMSGRDLILSAKTGSGKTLGYVLPLIRHCAHQPRCDAGEGPIGLVLVPTQELAVQVYALLAKLCKIAKLRTVASYGSSSLADNIKAVKGGCDAMVATPGRLLDLLTVNSGTAMSLQRVSFLVVDEADRLFDSGFIEHVEAFIKNIRPDRQLAMVSATLPRELKKLMVKHMKNPIEISVGGRPTPASNVDQTFLFFDEETYEFDELERRESPRLLKLLQILGEYSSGERLVLVFTQRKEEVDELMAKLTTFGYDRRIATLYSGMDPIDRQFALEYFAPGKQFILIATAVAERGLDIPALEMVVNYSMPDHVEAYIHRVGRTGRAGRRGRAISFFRRGVDDDLAPELSDAVERAGLTVPEEMYEIAARVRELRREGGAAFNVGLYRGYRKGRHHKMANRDQRELLREAAKAAGLEEYLSEDESASTGRDSDADESSDGEIEMVQLDRTNGTTSSTSLVVHQAGRSGAVRVGTAQADDRVAKALEFAKRTTEVELAGASGDGGASSNIRFQAEVPINDLPVTVRNTLQKGTLLREIADETSTTIIRKGVFFDPRFKHSHRLKEGERPLYLLIVGRSLSAVQQARQRLHSTKAEAMARVKPKTSATGAVI
eukprot:gene11410-7914_t